ncbi:Putative RNA-binding zinc finger family protein [Zea mays]|uniref:Putative RNA-binding zinc finger family protein n=1 Tax=Zea mays TaxID=4577 RepID=A0A1D6QGU1_MAIZE|nr:Putative RNA-binding zinc finger family protein [Zea mays]
MAEPSSSVVRRPPDCWIPGTRTLLLLLSGAQVFSWA